MVRICWNSCRVIAISKLHNFFLFVRCSFHLECRVFHLCSVLSRRLERVVAELTSDDVCRCRYSDGNIMLFDAFQHN